MRALPLLWWMTIGMLVAACERKPSAASVDASTENAPARAAPAPGDRPDLREPRLTSLSRRPSSIVDVAPGREIDADHPAGTTYVAAVLDNEYRRGEATLFEWDVASARPLDPDGTLLYRESDKEDNGKSADVRIATTPHGLFFAVTLEHGRFAILRKRGYALGADSMVEYLPPARNVSLAVDEHWLAVAYERTDGTARTSTRRTRASCSTTLGP